MNGLQVIVHDNRRVLTTGQLAECYGADVKVISNNYTRNADRYKEGKHFIRLTGEDLKSFKAIHQIDESLKFASILYLWTEKGAWHHAKSLGTDEAWDAYEMLVDEYYNVVEQQKKFTAREQLLLIMQANEETAQRVDAIEEKVNVLHDTMRIDSKQEKEMNYYGKAKAIEALGGKESNAYKQIGKQAFNALWKDMHNHFDVSTYKDIPKSRFDEAMRFISMWQPSTSLRMDIENCNRQIQLQLVK